jgi:IS5 family transposase
MLHIHVMQLVYNFSHPAMKGSLYEIESMLRLAGARLPKNIPDEFTIVNFHFFIKKSFNKSILKYFIKVNLMTFKDRLLDATYNATIN